MKAYISIIGCDDSARFTIDLVAWSPAWQLLNELAQKTEWNGGCSPRFEWDASLDAVVREHGEWVREEFERGDERAEEARKRWSKWTGT